MVFDNLVNGSLCLSEYISLYLHLTFRLERAKKLQEQKEKEILEKQQQQQQQEVVAGKKLTLAVSDSV